MAESLRLSFTLTRLQRILNPCERLVSVLGSVLILLLVPATVLGECLANGFSLLDAAKVVALLAIEGVIAGIVWLFFRRPLRTFARDLFGKAGSNNLVVEDDRVFASVGDSQLAFNRKLLIVGRGLCGASVVRQPFRYSITVPSGAIAFATLKAAIERDDCFWRDFWAGRIRRCEPRGAGTAEAEAITANVNTGSIPADADDGREPNTRFRISFTLTPLQRLLNPRYRFLYVLLGLFASVALLTLSLALLYILVVGLFGEDSGWARGAVPIWRPLLGLAVIGSFILLLNYVAVAFFMLGCRGLVFGMKYVNTLVVRDNFVLFGVDNGQTAVSRKAVTIKRGVWGTILVRHPHGTITLPQNAVSLAELKEAIEHNAVTSLPGMMPVPSHLSDCLIPKESGIGGDALDADVRCPCGSKRFDLLYPGQSRTRPGKEPIPCTAEIDGKFFFLISARCTKCQRVHLLIDADFHGWNGLVCHDARQASLPRPPLVPWRCLCCDETEHEASVQIYTEGRKDFVAETGGRFPPDRWPDAFGWFSMAIKCAGCGKFTRDWISYETM
jgi:hypothetical protein